MLPTSTKGIAVTGETWIDGDGDGDCDPGEAIEYVFFVENEGTVTLSGLRIWNELVGDSAKCGAFGASYLAPGASVTLMCTYQVCCATGKT